MGLLLVVCEFMNLLLFLCAQVSFTGSTDVGRKIMQAAATSNLKKVSLELGGKSPLLIFDDADVNKAAELALLGCFYNKVYYYIIEAKYRRIL